MDDKPFFSVIVPAHNSAEWIRKGLDSIRTQVWDNYELIVVCDACTDNTAEIAREYTDKVIITEFGLDGMARNAGLDAARGEWVLFMDDDDWFLHEYVFRQLAFMAGKHGEDMLLFSFVWKGRGYTSQEKQMYIAVWCKCWYREFIGETRFSDRPYWSDVDFMKAIMEKNPRIHRWDMPMYYYNYLRPHSISWRKKQGEIE